MAKDTTEAFERLWEHVSQVEGEAGERLRQDYAALSAALPSDKDDPGLVKKLADATTETDAFAVDAGRLLHVFKDGRYQPDGEMHVGKRVKELVVSWGLTKRWTRHLVGEVGGYISTDAPTLWDQQPSVWINVRNGLLNLNDLHLEPHTPDYLSTTQLPVEYDPAATCPAWERQLQETLPADTIPVVWEVLASLLAPAISLQQAILLSGDGGNGKSVLLAAITAFVGKENVTAKTLQQLEGNKFAAADLVGKLANICADLPADDLAGSSVFKKLTGGDDLDAERKYGHAFKFRSQARLLFSANHPPQSKDASESFFQRWVVLPFERVFRGSRAEIPRHMLDARLAAPQELSGALNKALAALPGLRQRGAFTVSPSMQAAWAEFRATTDPLAVWLDATTVTIPTAMIPRTALYWLYQKDCHRNDRPASSTKAFAAAIRRLRPAVSEARRTVGDQFVWCFLGIGLRTDPGSNGGGDSTIINHINHIPNCSENCDEGREVKERGDGEIIDMVDIADTPEVIELPYQAEVTPEEVKP